MGLFPTKYENTYTKEENVIRKKLIGANKIKKTDKIDPNTFKPILNVEHNFQAFKDAVDDAVKEEGGTKLKHKIILKRYSMNFFTKYLFMGSSSTPYGFASSLVKIGPLVKRKIY
jgi:hypothetical protein